jgi:hypothetical protein
MTARLQKNTACFRITKHRLKTANRPPKTLKNSQKLSKIPKKLKKQQKIFKKIFKEPVKNLMNDRYMNAEFR